MTASAEIASDAAGPGSFRHLLADEVRAHLARRRISNRKFAVIIGASAPWVDRRLNGTTPMTTDDIELFASALGMSPLELVASISPTRLETGPVTSALPWASSSLDAMYAQVIEVDFEAGRVSTANGSSWADQGEPHPFGAQPSRAS